MKTGYRQFRTVLTTSMMSLALLLMGAGVVVGQVDREALAQELEERYQERISGVDRITIVSQMAEGMMQGMESTTTLSKTDVDGRPTLRPVDAEGEFEGLFEGMYDDVLPQIVRNATTIDQTTRDGMSVYHIVVEDTEFLKSLDPSDAMVDDELAGEFELESAEIFLDTDELLLRSVSFRQTGEGGEEITVHFQMSDYRDHSGFPVPWVMEFELEGLDQMISEEQMAEARRAMEEMEQQLAQMPEAQRRMIEEQIRPQMEQFQGLLNSDEPGRAVMRVQDVQVQ